MSLANLTARKLRVLIGEDEQDWSLAVAAFGVGWDRLGESGLVSSRGEMEILPVLVAPESIDPAENPARWRPGTPVRVQVPNQAGNWVDHPQGRLFILEEPDLPEQQGSITVQLGCRLAWHDSFEFDDDQTGISVGTATNCATVAQRLLEANEIPSAAIDLDPWPYDLAIPDGKGPNGSFVQQAGGLAYSNDWRYLWQRPDGVVSASTLTLSIEPPTVTLTLGQDDVLYRRTKLDSTPVDCVKVAGVGVVVGEGQNPSVEISEVEGDRELFSEGGRTCEGVGVIARSTTTVWWAGNNIDGWHHYTKITEEAPRSAVAYAPGVISQPCSLTAWKETLVERRYGPDKRLLDVTTTEQQRAFTLCQTLADRGLLVWYTTRETVETPYTNDRETIERIVVTERVALVTLDPNASGRRNTATDPARLVDAKQTTTQWTQLSATTWRKSESALIPKALTNSSPDSSPTAFIGTTSSSTSSNGQNQPPACEFWDGGFIEQETEHQATATYTLPGGGTGRTRKALYTVPYGFSQSQCEAIALKHIGLMAGRHRAALIELPITDALLSAPPLFPCDVVMPSGEIRHYRIDGLAWEHTADQSKAIGTGILVGTTPAPSEDDPNPTPQPLTGTPVVSSTVPVTNDSAQIFATV